MWQPTELFMADQFAPAKSQARGLSGYLTGPTLLICHQSGNRYCLQNLGKVLTQKDHGNKNFIRGPCADGALGVFGSLADIKDEGGLASVPNYSSAAAWKREDLNPLELRACLGCSIKRLPASE